jgi:hypothetical protein
MKGKLQYNIIIIITRVGGLVDVDSGALQEICCDNMKDMKQFPFFSFHVTQKFIVPLYKCACGFA